MYLQKLVCEFDKSFTKQAIINEDNQGAIALVENPIRHNRTKHIDIRYHFIRKQVQRECIKELYLQTDLMIVDCLTRHVVKNKLEFCKKVLMGSKNVKSNG